MINIINLFYLYFFIIIFFYLMTKLNIKYLLFIPILIILSYYFLKNFILIKKIKNFNYQGKYLLLDLFLIYIQNNFKLIDYDFFIEKLNNFLFKINKQNLELHNEKNDIIEFFEIMSKINNMNKKYNILFKNIVLKIYKNYKIKLFNEKQYISYDISSY